MHIDKLVKFEQSTFEEPAYNPYWYFLANKKTVLASNGSKLGLLLRTPFDTAWFSRYESGRLVTYRNNDEITVRRLWNAEGIAFGYDSSMALEDRTIITNVYPFFDITTHTYREAKLFGVNGNPDDTVSRLILYWILDDLSTVKAWDKKEHTTMWCEDATPDNAYIYPLVGYQWNVYTKKFDLRMSFILSMYGSSSVDGVGANICLGGLGCAGVGQLMLRRGGPVMQEYAIPMPYGTATYPDADPNDDFFAYGIECDPDYAADPTNWYRSNVKRQYYTTENYSLSLNVDV